MKVILVTDKQASIMVPVKNDLQEKCPGHEIILRYLYRDTVPSKSLLLKASDIMDTDMIIFDEYYLSGEFRKRMRTLRYGSQACEREFKKHIVVPDFNQMKNMVGVITNPEYKFYNDTNQDEVVPVTKRR